jgi:hypothetical protein
VTNRDIIVVSMYVENDTAITPAANFTEATGSPVTNGALKLRTYWKRQTTATGAGETTGNYGFSITFGTGPWRLGVACRYTGCITSGNPFDVTSSVTNSGSTSTGAVSADTTEADRLLLWSSITLDGGTCTVPAGFSTAATNNNGHMVAHKTQAAAGPTGSLTGTWSVTTSSSTWLGALKPVATPRNTIINQAPMYRASTY